MLQELIFQVFLIDNKLFAVQFKSTGRYVMTLQQWPKPIQIRVVLNDTKKII